MKTVHLRHRHTSIKCCDVDVGCDGSTCAIRKTVSLDPAKPLVVPAGSDSFGQIGESSAAPCIYTLWYFYCQSADPFHRHCQGRLQ